MARITLDTMVTIVDSGTFVSDFASKEALAARPDLGEGGNLRPVVDLLVEQIECALGLVERLLAELVLPALPQAFSIAVSYHTAAIEHLLLNRI